MDTRTTARPWSLSRRSFIKAGAAATGALAATGLTSCAAVTSVDAAEQASERVAFTYHPVNCGNRCSLKCTVRDGRLCHVQGNRWQGVQAGLFSQCCLKGMSEVQHNYSPDRLLSPMKRVGERGSDQFEVISWDEALDTIADKIKEVGAGHVLVPYSSGVEYPYPFLRTCIGAQSAHEIGFDMAQGNGTDPTTGFYVVGLTASETRDIANSKLLVLVGVNIMETTLQCAQFVMDAKEAGAKLVVVDPTHTTTAAKADMWLPIRPGTDPAFYLGLVSAIIDNGWYDEDFMREHSGFPFLVDAKTGGVVRTHEPEVDEEDAPVPGSDDGVLVYCERQRKVVPLAEAVKPALEGTYSHEGAKLTTVFSLLKEQQKEYSTAWAAETTELDEGAIVEVARAYAQDGPSFLGMGFGGIDKFANADVAGHAASLLPALTGQVGQSGAGIGLLYGNLICADPELGGWELPEGKYADTPPETHGALFHDGGNSIRMVFNIGNCLQQALGNFKKTREWLDEVDLVVTVDPYDNDSARYSDIILPACTFLETREEVGGVQASKGHVLMQQKVLDPLGDSKTDFEIEHELAVRLGFADDLPGSMEEYVRAMFETDDESMEGITYEKLMENDGIMRADVPDEPVVGYEGLEFATPSGRMEVYHEALVDFGQALPAYEAPGEAYAGNPLAERYPLQFGQNRRRHRVHSQFHNSTWINQIFESAAVEMNPADAEARGLATGDAARVFNDRGEWLATCVVNDAIRPGSVNANEGAWMANARGTSFQDLINDSLNPRGEALTYGANIPFNDTLVEVAKA